MGKQITAKHLRLSDRTICLVRLVVGLALLPLGFLTAALFLDTSGVAPEAFTSWQDLGCGILLVTQPGPRFSGITACGRAYLTTTGGPHEAAGFYQVEFHDLLTSEPIGTVSSPNLEFAFSKSKRNLFANNFTDATLTELATGNRLATFDKGGPVQFCPNVGNNSVLLRSDSDAEIWDLETGQRLRSVFRPRVPISFGFSDGACEPKCITAPQPSGQLELWNESSGLRDLVLTESNGTMHTFTVSPDCGLIAIPYGKTITIRFLNGESSIRTLQADHDLIIQATYSGSALIKCGSRLRFSFNNLWLTQEYDTANPVVGKVRGVNWNLGQWLARRLPDEHYADLVNLETHETWKRIPAGHGVAFSDDDSRLITFGDQGRYIWTVPPRRQWITPWAWVALGAWLSLAIWWWKMRRRATLATPDLGLNP
jgi:hypothetical protein